MVQILKRLNKCFLNANKNFDDRGYYHLSCGLGKWQMRMNSRYVAHAKYIYLMLCSLTIRFLKMSTGLNLPCIHKFFLTIYFVKRNLILLSYEVLTLAEKYLKIFTVWVLFE